MRAFLSAVALLSCCLFGWVGGSSQAQVQPPTRLRFAIVGQSNAVGEATAATTWTYSGTVPQLPEVERYVSAPTAIYPDGNRAILSDPTHAGYHLFPINSSSVYGGSPWPLVARGLMQAGYNVEFVFCAKAGSSVGAWRYPVGDTSTSCLRGATIALCERAAVPDENFPGVPGPITLALWHQGESNAMVSTPEDTYLQVFTEVKNWMNSDLGCPVMPCLIQHCYDHDYPGQTAINNAIQRAWLLSGVVQGPDFRNINVMPTDTVHLKTASQMQTVASRWVTAILNWIGSGAPVRASQTSAYGLVG